MITRRHLIAGTAVVAGTTALAACGPKPAAGGGAQSLLNVSYDPTRELYKAYNALFAAEWKKTGGAGIDVKQSHGGSGSQALSVIGGLQADVVTLALAYDIDTIAQKTGRIAADWQTRLPDNASPYTSTIVFLVRAGNPKGIKDWGDLVKPGVEIVTPNPKTSGGARWNYLAAYAYALKQPGGDDAKAQAFLKQIYSQVPVLDSGARGATTTFVQRGIGDVLLSWENEAYLAIEELGPGKVDIVVPPTSILAEPPVAVVDGVVDAKGTRKAAEAYLKGLYDAPAQEVIAGNFYRPRSAEALSKFGQRFQKLELATIADFGGWTKAQATHFADGGVFDRIYTPKKG
jgi:sulfate transport system substrate-binding protein